MCFRNVKFQLGRMGSIRGFLFDVGFIHELCQLIYFTDDLFGNVILDGSHPGSNGTECHR